MRLVTHEEKTEKEKIMDLKNWTVLLNKQIVRD
jgi:hypothetical protein